MKISGYTTVRNAKEMDYPFEATIASMLDFCDQVVVVDSSDKDDGTSSILQDMVEKEPRLDVISAEIDWKAPNYGIYDGLTKAMARMYCTGDYLFQMDCDEVCQPGIRPKLEEIVGKNPDTPLFALPVVEYWGSKEKIRVDVNPWKWRLSKNDPLITHGIPSNLRWMKDGLLYARPGTDGCDYIWSNTGEIVPCLHFMNQNVNNVRQAAITSPEAADMYRMWFQSAIEQLPTVYHFSWWSIAAKIRKYIHFWNDSWLTLYGEKNNRPAGWNPFFSKPLNTVTEEEITSLAKILASSTGGHIFHQPWNGSKTNHVSLEHELPVFIEEWAKAHKD